MYREKSIKGLLIIQRGFTKTIQRLTPLVNRIITSIISYIENSNKQK